MEKKVFKGIGSAANAALIWQAAICFMLGIILFISRTRRNTYYYDRTERFVDSLIGLLPFLLILFAFLFLVQRVECAKNTIVISKEGVSAQYINPLTINTSQKTADFSIRNISGVSVERMGRFQYVVISTVGEKYKIAISDSDGVKNAVLYFKRSEEKNAE